MRRSVIASAMLGIGVATWAGAGHAAGNAGAAPPDPATFVEKAAQDGMTEVQLGKIAREKGTSADVRSFGARMIKDHGQANEELNSIAKPKGLKVPIGLDKEHAKMVQELSTKSGVEFDRAYAEHMSMDHTKAIALFSSASTSSDRELAAFAKKTLPTLEEHKKMADSIASKLRTASAPGQGGADR